jgi:hypothetical protein
MLSENHIKETIKYFPPCSIFRIIIINKIEYFLIYSHDKIYTDYSENNSTNLGKIILITKNPNNEKKYYKYYSKDEIILKESLNISLLNNEENLLINVINSLEGKDIKKNISLKLDENTNKFKITSVVSNKGINLILFSVDMKKIIMDNFEEILELSIESFQKKKKISDNLKKKYVELKELQQNVNLKRTTIERQINEKLNTMYNFFCEELNKKKYQAREINKQIDNYYKKEDEEKINRNKKSQKIKDNNNEIKENEDKIIQKKLNSNDNNLGLLDLL